MISFEYRLASYCLLLEDLATFFKIELKDGLLYFPEEIATGFMKAHNLDKLNFMMYDFTMHEDFIFKRQKDGIEYYTLIFDELLRAEGLTVKINSETLIEDDNRIRASAIYLAGFLHDSEIIINKGTRLRGLRIYFTPEWIKKYLHLSDVEDELEKYVSVKTEDVWHKPVDPESRMLLDEILNNKAENLLFYQNRVLRIAEIYFDWLCKESRTLYKNPGISRNDIEAAQKVEAIITRDGKNIPPTIKELSREVAMSESKLKKVFKSVFGLPIYEYFQKQRMQRAKMMLLSGNYAIKDVGYTLGYANLSNFTLAFKKEFGKLPSELIREVR